MWMYDTFVKRPLTKSHRCCERCWAHARQNRWVFNPVLKCSYVSSGFVMSSGSKFHTAGPETRKLLGPKRRVLVRAVVRCPRASEQSNFSMQEHVSSVISSSAQSLYALRVLRSHGFDDQSLQTVFQATVISKLQYASSAWWGFTNAAQRDQLESFLRRAVKVGFHKNNSPTLSAICEAADDKLFRRITTSPCHPLYRLLPPTNVPPYDLRPRTHQYQLPDKWDSLVACNYLIRMLYK